MGKRILDTLAALLGSRKVLVMVVTILVLQLRRIGLDIPDEQIEMWVDVAGQLLETLLTGGLGIAVIRGIAQEDAAVKSAAGANPAAPGGPPA